MERLLPTVKIKPGNVFRQRVMVGNQMLAKSKRSLLSIFAFSILLEPVLKLAMLSNHIIAVVVRELETGSLANP